MVAITSAEQSELCDSPRLREALGVKPRTGRAYLGSVLILAAAIWASNDSQVARGRTLRLRLLPGLRSWAGPLSAAPILNQALDASLRMQNTSNNLKQIQRFEERYRTPAPSQPKGAAAGEFH